MESKSSHKMTLRRLYPTQPHSSLPWATVPTRARQGRLRLCPYSQPAPWWRLFHSSFSRRLEPGLHLTSRGTDNAVPEPRYQLCG